MSLVHCSHALSISREKIFGGFTAGAEMKIVVANAEKIRIAVLVSDSLLPSIHLNYAFTFETRTHTSPLCLFPVHYQPNLLTFAQTYFQKV